MITVFFIRQCVSKILFYHLVNSCLVQKLASDKSCRKERINIWRQKSPFLGLHEKLNQHLEYSQYGFPKYIYTYSIKHLNPPLNKEDDIRLFYKRFQRLS